MCINYHDCFKRGGFWQTYSIHDQEWVPCEKCENSECPYKKNLTNQELHKEN